MKNWKGLILSLGVIFGIFIALGSVSAEEILEPKPGEAQFVNGWLYVNGVSFLQGTILNSGPNPITISDSMMVNGPIYRRGGEGADLGPEGNGVGGSPVIIGDNLRVDGQINGGPSLDVIKVADTIMPTADDAFDLGTSDNRFSDGYFDGNLEVNGYLYSSGGFSSSNLEIADNIMPAENSVYNLGAERTRFLNGYFSDRLEIAGEHATFYVRDSTNTAVFSVHSSGNVFLNHLTAREDITIEDDLTVQDDVSIESDLNIVGSITSSDESLQLDDIINIAPRTGTPPTCNSSRRGDIIFSRTAIGGQGQANKLYCCDGTNWYQL